VRAVSYEFVEELEMFARDDVPREQTAGTGAAATSEVAPSLVRIAQRRDG